MSSRFFLLSLFLVGFPFFNAFAQPDSLMLGTMGPSMEKLVPKGWKVLASAKGDLNKDKAEDLVFVIQKNDPKNKKPNEGLGTDTLDLNPRILAIYFLDVKKKLFVKKLQSNIVPVRDSPTMDEPLDELKITDRGVLQIGILHWYSAGTWFTSSHDYKFRYQNNAFALIGYDRYEYHRGSGESTDYSINFSTRKMSISRSHSTEDAPAGTTWKDFKLEKLKTISSLGKLFAWEFEGIYL